jgi:Ca2+-binding EF-hand superfamily protein
VQAIQSTYPSFEQCDRNNDGWLDKSEVAAVPGLSANFERADTNKDGKLDKAEFAKAISGLDIQK